MLPSHPAEPRTRQLRPSSSRQRVRFNSTLSRDASAIVQMLNDAIVGNIPAVRRRARQLSKSGKDVEEEAAAVASCGPLHMAAWAGRLEMCKFLIEDLRLNVNAPGDEGKTPLSYAVYGCGSTSVVRFLLDRGAKSNKATINGLTPLHFAAKPDTNSEETRLWVANTRDTCEIAELLLSRGADVDPISVQGTPLLIAAQSGNAGLLELLLRHQANPNTVLDLFYTPLSLAVLASSLKCAELLIKAGADLNAGKPVLTPLILAAERGVSDCMKCLLEAGADANIRDEVGRTAAEIVTTHGWKDCVEILSSFTSPPGTDVPLLNANDGCALKEQGEAAFEENDGFNLKIQGDAAFKGKDYADALALYTKAMEINPDDATLYAKRSLCWLHTSEEDKALVDAYTYRTMKMDLSNSCCEQAAALILVKEYGRACRALVSALKLDLRSDDLD